MTVLSVAGKTSHAVVRISLASCIYPVCPVFQAYLVDQSAAGFDGDSGLALKRFEI